MIGTSALTGMVFMQTLSFGQLYSQWQSSGVFDFFLPALLIFAVVFGILSSTNILGGKKGINFVIALAIALIAMQYDFVTTFFSVLFPNFAIGLAIILVVVILMGVFVNKGNLPEFSNTVMWGALGVGAIVAIITLNQFDWFGSFWWQENWTSVLWVVVIVLILAPFFTESKSKEEREKRRGEYGIPFLQMRAPE